VDFELSEDEQALRDTVADFAAKHCSLASTRSRFDAELSYDPDVWRRACRELDLTAVALPEPSGAAAGSLVATGIVLLELGRQLAPLPFLSSVVLTGAALQAMATSAARAELLPGIAAGDATATVAVLDPAPGRGEAPVVRARRVGDQHRLSGTKVAVLDAAAADTLLVVAPEWGLFAVDRAAEGVEVRRRESLDLTRRQYDVFFTDAPARLISDGADVAAGGEHVRAIAAAALAAEQLGCAQAAMQMAVDYARLRHQFGRPIGSFQAVKHLCAEMLVDVEGATVAAFYALWAGDADPGELPLAAEVAQAHCAEVAASVTAKNIQVHGGIGFTWEHDAQLYFRRARSSALLFGAPEFHREQIYAHAIANP